MQKWLPCPDRDGRETRDKKGLTGSTAVIVTANYLCHLKNIGLFLVPEINLSETAFKSLQIKPDRLVQLGEKLEEMREKINGFVQSMK